MKEKEHIPKMNRAFSGYYFMSVIGCSIVRNRIFGKFEELVESNPEADGSLDYVKSVLHK